MKLNYLLSSVIVILLAVYSCTKISDTEIGTGLIPPIDGVITKDTIIEVNVKNSGDSVIRVLMAEDHVVGYVADPLFGNTDARINFQVALPGSSYHFEVPKDSLYLDSVVLVMAYTGIWGDTTKPAFLHVKELDQNQAFVYDTVYKSSENFLASSELSDQPGGTPVYPTVLKDTGRYFEDSGANMIRVRLNPAFGRRLLDYDSTNAFKTDSAFKTFFKGFQVSADPANNALLRIALSNSNTKLAIYYNYKMRDSVGKRDTAVRYFTFNTLASAHSNYIARDRTAGQINSYPPNTPGTKNDDLIFLQAGPGTHATVTIDSTSLAGLPNIIVHRAELLLEQSPDVSDQFLTPPYLFLLAKDDTSNFVIPGFKNPTTFVDTRDAVFSGGYLSNLYDFGGVPAKVGGATTTSYNFNISRYIQGIVSNKNPQYPLVLFAPYNEAFKQYQNLPIASSYGYVSTTILNTAGSGRVRLYGGGNDVNNTHRVRLHIVYSIPH